MAGPESALAQSAGGAATRSSWHLGHGRAQRRISGNRILHDIVGPSTRSRLDRDVLAQSGATHLIVCQGIADLLVPDLIGVPAQTVSAAQIIQGHVQIITRARAMGLRVYGATLFPADGYPFPGPSRLRPDYDSGDHVHPNDIGYRAMADAIDLRLFRRED
jgi:lysophospholipase L1-like esterase